MTLSRVYLDYNSTSIMRPGVCETMQAALASFYGNPSSIHAHGRDAKNAIERAREIIAAWLKVRRDQIIFTSGGSEAINLAIKGVAFNLRAKGNHIITTAVEHDATLQTCYYLSREFGFSLTVLPVDSTGQVRPDFLRKAITPKTILFSVIHAQNEIGTLQPVHEMIKIAHQQGVLVHVDGVQAVGKIPVDLSQLGPDLYSITAHKIGGPQGIGALFLRDDLKIHALIHGGHHERDLRAGTENVLGIIGFGEAARISAEKREVEVAKTLNLRTLLVAGLKKTIPDCVVNGHPIERLANTINVAFPGVDALALSLSLDLSGISVSTGSACLSGGIEPSPVLKALGLPKDVAEGSVRFSLGWGNTEEEINHVVEEVTRIVKRLKGV